MRFASKNVKFLLLLETALKKFQHCCCIDIELVVDMGLVSWSLATSLFLAAFCMPITGLPTQTSRTVFKINVLLKAGFLLHEHVFLMIAIHGQGRVVFPSETEVL